MPGPRPHYPGCRFWRGSLRSKDTVLKEVPEEWVKRKGCWKCVRRISGDKTCT
ncbi:hypothetical protein KCP71_13985 [Salmonella enterica subsp. enterica]|nr:hypothetical protein KCP71_13985 [Salmonella enterica subsp. enterica]